MTKRGRIYANKQGGLTAYIIDGKASINKAFLSREAAQAWITKQIKSNGKRGRPKGTGKRFKRRPSIKRCAICACKVEDPHTERRPTGKDFKMQTWAYCDKCWNEFMA